MNQLDPAFAASTQGAKPAPLDPQVQLFVQRMAADASKFPRRDTVSIAEGRDIAEKVRAPWTAGGPLMARTTERQVPTRHGEVMIRTYYPKEQRMPGAFFYIHGGGFVLFSVDTHDRLMREYAERAGIVVIGINYTRAPDAKFPQPIEECIDTVDWLIAHAGEIGFDKDQFFIGGDSAGGNLRCAQRCISATWAQAPSAAWCSTTRASAPTCTRTRWCATARATTGCRCT